MDCKTAQDKIIPYIERKLNDHEMEDFIEHIQECKTCNEELEVYFTIYYALEKLDNNEDESFNIRELLKKDLSQAHQQVRKRYLFKFYRCLFIGIMSVLGSICLFTGIQSLIFGSFENTTIYLLFHEETDKEIITQSESISNSSDTEKDTEPETNRKRQIIVTIPETEEWTGREIQTIPLQNAIDMSESNGQEGNR